MPVETDRQPQTELELTDEGAVRSLLARANLLRMRGQWNDAIAACTDALRHDPRSASAHSLLGEIYETQGKTDDAAQWFAMALAIDPNNASDRARWERLTELQRVRLRTQDIAASAAGPKVIRERTLEWFDRAFPPGRSDSVARLILAMSVGFAILIAACAGFIYVYITPHHDPALAHDTSRNSLEVEPQLPTPPVVMTPTVLASPASLTTANVATIATASKVETAAKLLTDTKSVASTAPTSLTTPLVNPDAATLRTHLAAQLNGADALLAGVSFGENHQLLIDLLLPAGDPSEPTEHLRDRALRAGSQAAHALAILLPADTQRTIVRIARAIAPSTITAGITGESHPRMFDMVLAAEAPLHDFHDVQASTMTASELMSRFQNPQWYPTGGGATGTNATKAIAAGNGTTSASGEVSGNTNATSGNTGASGTSNVAATQ